MLNMIRIFGYTIVKNEDFNTLDTCANCMIRFAEIRRQLKPYEEIFFPVFAYIALGDREAHVAREQALSGLIKFIERGGYPRNRLTLLNGENGPKR